MDLACFLWNDGCKIGSSILYMYTYDAAMTTTNLAYHHWWTQDQKVKGLPLTSMEEDIACQLISCEMAQAVWTAVSAMYGA